VNTNSLLSGILMFVLMFFTACGDKTSVEEKEATTAQRPNIIFIMSDDHTTQAVGAYQSRLAGLNPTPNIDALAKEGALFSNDE